MCNHLVFSLKCQFRDQGECTLYLFRPLEIAFCSPNRKYCGTTPKWWWWSALSLSMELLLLLILSLSLSKDTVNYYLVVIIAIALFVPGIVVASTMLTNWTGYPVLEDAVGSPGPFRCRRGIFHAELLLNRCFSNAPSKVIIVRRLASWTIGFRVMKSRAF